MAKQRQGRQDEVMLIPFLDILCSLIGVLILIIVVVCVAQVQKSNGRTKQDVELSANYQTLLRQLKEDEKNAASLKAIVTDLERLQKDMTAKEAKISELRKQLDFSASSNSANEKLAAKIQEDIKNLIAQIQTLSKAIPPLESEIDKLRKLLAERQKKPDEMKPSVVVRPSGGGTKQNQPVFLVESAGGNIVIHKNKTEQIRVARDNVNVDKDYNAFLKTVKNTGHATLIFLVRRDGWSTYSRAAGWAEQEFGLNTGKLPIPGDGALDLSLFEKH